MAKFFIHRPVLAIVISLLICLGGFLSIQGLPVSLYPEIAPPRVTLWITYPGASARTVEEAVTVLIEREMNGVPNLMYMDSISSAGSANINLTFKQGTDGEMANVEVQNRLKLVEPNLPDSVRQNGIYVERASNSFLCIVGLYSEDGRYDDIDLGEMASASVLPVLRRVDGVGRATLYGTEKAMRIWLDPAKMTALELTSQDVVDALASHSAKLTPGALGGDNAPADTPISASILTRDYLTTPEDFRQMPLRTGRDGATLSLGDAARVELAGKEYSFQSRINGRKATGVAIMLTDGANALATAKGVQTAMESIVPFLPEGVDWAMPYDTSGFVDVAVSQVVSTLAEAVGLVFLVMFLFMQNLRATIIPTIVVPVALLGTSSAMFALGFSVNLLTLFGMVLAIGILVDDAIVVVENVERIMMTENLPPREATEKAMGQISGAIIGITLVLVAVFIPMAFFGGAVGNIYRQFSLTLAVSIAFSAFLALSLTPALCAAFLKPASGHQEKKGFFGWFNRMFNRGTRRYGYTVKNILDRPRRWLAVFAVIAVLAVVMVYRLPTAFLPSEDQGSLLATIMLPSGSTQSETVAKIKELEDYALANEPVSYIYGVQGYSIYGSGTQMAMAFLSLKDIKERRGRDLSVDEVARRINEHFAADEKAMVMAFNLPPLPGLGQTNGFDLRLQDRSGLGRQAFSRARDQLLEAAANRPELSYAIFAGLSDSPQMLLDIDRKKAMSMGVTVEEINSAISTVLGSSQVADFMLGDQVRKVIVQAEGDHRRVAADVGRINVRSASGEMVPLSSFIRLDWTLGPSSYDRYNGYPSFTINGESAPGLSSGLAMDTMVDLIGGLPPGIGFEWSGQSFEEIVAGNQTVALYTLSVLIIFLVLAGLYESWSIPVSVLLVVPLGILGAALAMSLRGLNNDIYFKVGLITVIGLSAKNAILIVEVAKDLWQKEGRKLIPAVLEAARLRLRPIIMTSLAFGFGVLPLAFSTGAGSGAQVAIGTAVLGGIITATILAVFLVPLFFVAVVASARNIMKLRKRKDSAPASPVVRPLTDKI
ncbi:hydrophobe/amphiphile efflux-1 family RND transporter [Deltaproteobacteria bacterium Smac51]|nr:hydrophobe/amphiphile efflux-1 family RND transporter [Deltaproteobacteria bacterium Smac51]